MNLRTDTRVEVSSVRSRGVRAFHRSGHCLPLYGPVPTLMEREYALKAGYRPCRKCNP